MAYYAYMLRCADNSIYSGYTTDLDRRVAAHNAGTASKYTRSRKPVEVVYFEEFDSKSEALRREAAFKKLSHKQKEELIFSK